MIGDASSMRAGEHGRQADATKPDHGARCEPRGIAAVLMTAPTPVMTAQPNKRRFGERQLRVDAHERAARERWRIPRTPTRRGGGGAARRVARGVARPRAACRRYSSRSPGSQSAGRPRDARRTVPATRHERRHDVIATLQVRPRPCRPTRPRPPFRDRAPSASGAADYRRSPRDRNGTGPPRVPARAPHRARVARGRTSSIARGRDIGIRPGQAELSQYGGIDFHAAEISPSVLSGSTADNVRAGSRRRTRSGTRMHQQSQCGTAAGATGDAPRRISRAPRDHDPLDGQRPVRPRQQRRLLLVFRHRRERLPDRGQRLRRALVAGDRHRRRDELPLPASEMSFPDTVHAGLALEKLGSSSVDLPHRPVPGRGHRARGHRPVRARLRGQRDASPRADPGPVREALDVRRLCGRRAAKTDVPCSSAASRGVSSLTTTLLRTPAPVGPSGSRARRCAPLRAPRRNSPLRR